MYKFEIHLHTNNCSACALSSSKEMIDAAVKKGYSGIVITNHFYHGNTCVDRNATWQNFVGTYIEDYEDAKEYGEEKNITVFFGLEEGFAPGKEMLIYGVEPECFLNHPEFIMMSAREKSDFVHECGGICICAHPFRNRRYIPDPHTPPDPDLFDGIEGFNLANKAEENEKAFIFGLNNKKIIVSGSDTHQKENFGNAGIAFYEPVTDYKVFIDKIKKSDFELIYPNEI
ncbi:MAG: PHP domain-containing protein [Clostridia bacterium]|nr:PHP domain-containing protein [Clostridia bacterium]